MVKKKEALILKNATALKEQGESALFNFWPDNSQSVVELPVEKLVAWAGQPRTYFSPEAMSQLVSSVKNHGVQLPLIVRTKEDLFEVVAGERRWRAAQEAGLSSVPAIVREMDDGQALEAALSENLDREDLNPIEELDALLKFLSLRLQMEVNEIPGFLYGMKRNWEKVKKKSGENVFPDQSDPRQQDVMATFEAYGKNWYSFTCSQLKLKKLPEDLYEAIAKGRIEYTKGLRFKSLKDEQQREELLEQAIAKNWSIREIGTRIKQLLREESNWERQPQHRVTTLSGLLRKSKLWETEPKTWKKIENYFQKIESLVEANLEGRESQESESG